MCLFQGESLGFEAPLLGGELDLGEGVGGHRGGDGQVVPGRPEAELVSLEGHREGLAVRGRERVRASADRLAVFSDGGALIDAYSVVQGEAGSILAQNLHHGLKLLRPSRSHRRQRECDKQFHGSLSGGIRDSY